MAGLRLNPAAPFLVNAAAVGQTGFAADTYLTGSNILLPPGRPIVGSTYTLTFDMTKTAAGTAAATLIVRYGTAGAIGDTARLTFTFGAGTAAVDSGVMWVQCHFRTVGAGTAAVLAGQATWVHHLAATGLHSTGASGVGAVFVVSGGFDSTPAGSVIGASFNGGASFAGTNTICEASLAGL